MSQIGTDKAPNHRLTIDVDGARCGAITLASGDICYFDECDRELVESRNWFLSSRTCPYPESRTNGKRVLLHKLIMGVDGKVMVDHINGNGLDNRRSNLRIASYSQNNANRKKKRGCKTIYKGVGRQSTGRWAAAITINRVTISLGTHNTEEEAARAYDEGARKYHGEFACLNFPNEGEQSALRPLHMKVSA